MAESLTLSEYCTDKHHAGSFATESSSELDKGAAGQVVLLIAQTRVHNAT